MSTSNGNLNANTPEKSFHTRKRKASFRFVAFLCFCGLLTRHLSAAEPRVKGFLSIDGGVARTQDVTFDDGLGNSTRVGFEHGLRFDLRGGAKSTGRFGFGGEFDLGVIYNQLKGNPITLTDSKLELYQVPMMVDGFLSWRVVGPLSLRAGGGIGGVYGTLAGDGTSFLGFDNDVTFGYQGFGEISCSLGSRVDLGVGYKFLGTTSHDWGSGIKMDGTRSHALMAELTINF
jgi:opacity protein-like surface antigen